MNPKETLLLIKGEIKTSEVISCTPSEDAQSWAVTFASGKTYTYKSSSIELLDSPEQPDPNLYQISRNGQAPVSHYCHLHIPRKTGVFLASLLSGRQ